MPDATHLLDGKEPVTDVRYAKNIVDAIIDNAADPAKHKAVLYPQIDREKLADHGLYLARTIPEQEGAYDGDLLVTGDRLKEISS